MMTKAEFIREHLSKHPKANSTEIAERWPGAGRIRPQEVTQARRALGLPRPPGSGRKDDRDASIVAWRAQGVSIELLGQWFNLSESRVRQIVARAAA